MKLLLLAVYLVLFPIPLRADELSDLKIELAIAEVRAARLQEMLLNDSPASVSGLGGPTRPAILEQPKIEQRYEVREETRYRSVRVKHCDGKKCWYTTEQRPYQVKVRVPVEAEPTEGQNADEYATPLDACKRILEFMRPTSPKTLLDIGSGDGRMVVEWARWLGYPAIGVEQDPERIALSRAWAEEQGVSHLVKFVQGDFTKMQHLPDADIVYLYQFPEELSSVRDKLNHYDLVVSFCHRVPGLTMTSHNHGEFFSWQKPVPTDRGVQAVRYGNRMYTGRVCSNRNCAMCNAIEAMLNAQRGYQ